jgi:formiminoglutamase
MEGLKIYDGTELRAYIRKRNGEVKIGQKAQFVSSLDEIAGSAARFVLLGIPEDIGIRANQGIAGAATAWEPALKALLNVQSTPVFIGDELLVLGHFNFEDPEQNNPEQLQQKVAEIDDLVYPVIQKIIASGKIPVVIGGGHNNAYPIIKGTSLASNGPVDIINVDAHADLRPADGRHSGNAFSYAIKDGFLTRYGVFGLHENYNNNSILQTIASNHHIYPVFFDALLKSDQPILSAWNSLLKKTGPITGMELDLDAIENVLSSAMSPSGFPLNEIRRLVLASTKKFAYLHICEGAVALTDGRKDETTAKVIAYLISDFIKAQK